MALEPGPAIALIFGGAAVVSVLLYLQIFRLSFQLRKARAFLHFRQYEPIIIGSGVAVLVCTVFVLYALATDPLAIDLHDFVVYLLFQLLLAGVLFYMFKSGRGS